MYPAVDLWTYLDFCEWIVLLRYHLKPWAVVRHNGFNESADQAQIHPGVSSRAQSSSCAAILAAAELSRTNQTLLRS